MIETQKFSTMTRKEVPGEPFVGVAHDRLMAASRIPAAVRTNAFQHIHSSSAGQPSRSIPPAAAVQQHPSSFGCLSSIQDKANIIPKQPATDPLVNPSQPLKPMGAASATTDQQSSASALSTIAILRRETMYDSLVLVKNFRHCLNGYTLEFPTTPISGSAVNADCRDTSGAKTKSSENQALESAEHDHDLGCGRTKLVSLYLDGDDPMCQSPRNGFGASKSEGDIVYVPINGLLDRLENFERHGIVIDSRVYAFAMGLKTAERILTSSTEKEIQEAPPL